jgi:hypothetical protein
MIDVISEMWIHSSYWVYPDEDEPETDPFNRFSNKSIDFYLFEQVARRENVNVTVHQSRLSKFKQIIGNLPMIVYTVDVTQTYGPNQVLTKWKGLKFLTCYRKRFIGFNFYTTPFDFDLWIGFL